MLLLLLMPAQAASEPSVAARGVIDDRYPTYPVAFAEGVTGFSHLTYATLPGYRPLTLDLYLPADRHLPRQRAFPWWSISTAAQGYMVASVNYRLSGEARSPAAAMDIKTVLRWLRSKAAEYRIDPTRAATWAATQPSVRRDWRRGPAARPMSMPRTPPMLLIHGTADRLVPYGQSQLMAARLERSGVPVELMALRGIDHGLIGSNRAQTRTRP